MIAKAANLECGGWPPLVGKREQAPALQMHCREGRVP